VSERVSEHYPVDLYPLYPGCSGFADIYTLSPLSSCPQALGEYISKSRDHPKSGMHCQNAALKLSYMTKIILSNIKYIIIKARKHLQAAKIVQI